MKHVVIAAGAVAALALTSAPAAAAVSATANANAQAKIFRPLTLTKNTDLNFGTIVISGSSFTGEVVQLDQAGAVTCGGGTNLVCDTTNASAATFTVVGTNNQTVDVTVPATVSLTGSNGGTLSMSTDAPATVALGASGNAGVPFGVGGSISIDSTTTDGVYTGNFDVTANYQ
jgi:hypothetical protein